MSIIIVIIGVVIYFIIAALSTPRIYARLRDVVKNTYSYQNPHQTARFHAAWYALIWPVGFVLFRVRLAMDHVDVQAELSKKERAELDRLRAEAMRELG